MQPKSNDFVLGRVSQVLNLLLKEAIDLGDVVVDATLGNGNDAELLLELVGETGYLFGFDVQPQAILSSQSRLSRFKPSQFQLIQDSHHHMKAYLQHKNPKAVVFNLGYLPKADKAMTTKWDTTKVAIETACELIVPGGFVVITAYPGHEAGAEENEALKLWLKTFDQKVFEVSHFEMMNQVNHPPVLYWISKRKPRKSKMGPDKGD